MWGGGGCRMVDAAAADPNDDDDVNAAWMKKMVHADSGHLSFACSISLVFVWFSLICGDFLLTHNEPSLSYSFPFNDG